MKEEEEITEHRIPGAGQKRRTPKRLEDQETTPTAGTEIFSTGHGIFAHVYYTTIINQ